MTDLPLGTLGLEKKWPRLVALQEEITDLTRQVGSANSEVRRLEAALSVARDEDVAAQAQALRRGKTAPDTSREEKVKRDLEAARRDATVLQRAIQDAQDELGQYRARHRDGLFRDVAQARGELARDLAKHAQAAATGFGKWSDLHYLLKDLAPPVDYAKGENAEPSRSSVHFAIHTTKSDGPARGEVEAALGYLASLAPADDAGEPDAA